MNYYSIEFFKFYLKELNKLSKNSSNRSLDQMKSIIDKMDAFIKDREENNKDAYSTKHMRKPIFK